MNLKRSFDVIVSILVTGCILSWLLPLLALLIKLDSRGPVFFVQRRVGRNGVLFACYKLRTMVINDVADERPAAGNDGRITRVGRWLRQTHLDELPQFFNVLVGQMSLVGPRPPIAAEVEQYELAHLKRLDVLPGMTGLWQVEARQDPSFDSYISLDTAYVENWNLMLDLRILARTIGVVVGGTGS